MQCRSKNTNVQTCRFPSQHQSKKAKNAVTVHQIKNVNIFWEEEHQTHTLHSRGWDWRLQLTANRKQQTSNCILRSTVSSLKLLRVGLYIWNILMFKNMMISYLAVKNL
jgi:hypothetical protein